MGHDAFEGQQQPKARLEAALRRGRLPHATLLLGPAGVGRLALARELAGALLCSESDDGPCGRCRGCGMFLRGAHPDYEEAGVPEGKQDLPIDLVRELQRKASIKPVIARGRVFVIRDAERMNQEAANCFLKTLEEPPGECRFILIASSLWDIPQTIVSRCQVVRLAAPAPAPVERMLLEEGMDREDAWWLARRSWGSPGLARALRDMGLPAFNRRLCEHLLSLGSGDVFGLADWIGAEADRAGGASRAAARSVLQELLECLAVFYRDVAASALAGQGAELFNRPFEEPIRRLASRRSLDSIIESADLVFEAIESIAANANRRLALDDLFVGLAAMAGSPEGPAGA